jgi:hypothetical protein
LERCISSDVLCVVGGITAVKELRVCELEGWRDEIWLAAGAVI